MKTAVLHSTASPARLSASQKRHSFPAQKQSIRVLPSCSSRSNYKDAIHPRPQSLEELAETTAFEYTYQNEPLLVYHPDRFAGLLQRAGVGPELVEDVVQALKDRSLCTSEKVKINTEGAGRRYLAIPTKKFINSSIPSIPAGNEEDNNV